MEQDKLLGDERRERLLGWLKETRNPITGSELARRTKVSRQVIVQDISLLKAKNEPIIATAQGYVYINQDFSAMVSKVIACKHTPEQTEQELTIMVDHGVTVKDVIVEHPVYGEITANLRLSNRREVQHFLSRIQQSNASLLSNLTDGIHLHTLVATNEAALIRVERELEKEGFLLV
ncbi:transcription repressor NadR [Pullulanibacillus sp. KACC 23026]|uniref:transcription repressor NadR n=1 Tax=Pullulanibacillus sp. KACC 23026 TaxID=3028315 RepID=UPI0023AFAAB3|nr:transcription repressor NadR [Pullulanibacillus sp. KACC 23026]WEG14064.1 transcription repressor NadR [Pullulanibacillus sp. KACC 23026]